MFDVRSLLRPELRDEEPYGAPQLDVPVRLNVNENPYPPSEAICKEMGEAIAQAAKGINRYPDREAWELRSDLANYLGFALSAGQVWAANGSNEVLSQLLGAFGGPGRKVLAFTPTYSMYPEYARNTHTEYVTAPRERDFTVGVSTALHAIAEHGPSVIVIASPNNPTGTTTPLERIREIAQGFSGVVVVDEAYQEFSRTPENSALNLLGECPNVVVSRTMSKAFAFAGGRLGYLAASTQIVDAIRIVRLPYHLSTQSQVVARVALKHADEMLARVDDLRAARDELLRRLPELGVEVLESDSNFVLFGVFDDRHDVWSRLLERGVLVREVGPEGWLRVNAGTPAEMDAFYTAMEQVLKEVGYGPHS
ncbi:MAG: histidinol-phosphate transaminase [Propionibacteriaceae bacterium]|jgi:histidinol-phosphate aminotransferase|nr:histidinol-phosphate transaminase [Propionibacteriaceae bacterium]